MVSDGNERRYKRFACSETKMFRIPDHKYFCIFVEANIFRFNGLRHMKQILYLKTRACWGSRLRQIKNVDFKSCKS
jgi:hypothetical protein